MLQYVRLFPEPAAEIFSCHESLNMRESERECRRWNHDAYRHMYSVEHTRCDEYRPIILRISAWQRAKETERAPHRALLLRNTFEYAFPASHALPVLLRLPFLERFCKPIEKEAALQQLRCLLHWWTGREHNLGGEGCPFNSNKLQYIKWLSSRSFYLLLS